MNPERRAAIVQTVLDLPLHRSLGLRLAVDGDPAAGVELAVSEATTNPSAVLHGGLVPLLLDVTCFLRLLDTLPDGSHAVTVSSTASIIAAARDGDDDGSDPVFREHFRRAILRRRDDVSEPSGPDWRRLHDLARHTSAIGQVLPNPRNAQREGR